MKIGAILKGKLREKVEELERISGVTRPTNLEIVQGALKKDISIRQIQKKVESIIVLNDLLYGNHRRSRNV